MQVERRAVSRHPTDITATYVLNDGRRVSVRIVNQSAVGLCVRLAQPELILREGYILFEHRMEPCRVAWQASRWAGLHFSDGPTNPPPRLVVNRGIVGGVRPLQRHRQDQET